jgi:hypothetical protein
MKFMPKTACPACGDILLSRNLASHLETPGCHRANRNLGAHRSIIELGLIRTATELTPGVSFRFETPEGGLTGYYTYDWVLLLSGHLDEACDGPVAGTQGLLRVLHAMQRHRQWGSLQEAPPGAAREAIAFGVFFESLEDAARQRFYLTRARKLSEVIQELQLRRLVGATSEK